MSRDRILIGLPIHLVSIAAILATATVPAGAQVGGSDSLVLDRSGALPGAPSAGRVGEATATGDFNGDGFADLAIGARSAAVRGLAQAGTVFVVYGSRDGIVPGAASRGTRAGGRGCSPPTTRRSSPSSRAPTGSS
jgi:hypothetical protein